MENQLHEGERHRLHMRYGGPCHQALLRAVHDRVLINLHADEEEPETLGILLPRIRSKRVTYFSSVTPFR